MFGLGQMAVAAQPYALSAMWLNLARYASGQAGGMTGGALATLGSPRYTNALRALADNANVRPLAMQWLRLPAYYHRDGLMAIASYASAMSSAYARMSGARSAPVPTPPGATHGIGSYVDD